MHSREPLREPVVYSVFAWGTLESRYESLWSIRYSHGALSTAVTSESLAFGFAFTLCEPRAASPADVRAVHRRRPRGLSINIIVLTLCVREVRDTARMADRAVLCLHSYGDTQRTARLSQTEKKSSERTTNKLQGSTTPVDNLRGCGEDDFVLARAPGAVNSEALGFLSSRARPRPGAVRNCPHMYSNITGVVLCFSLLTLLSLGIV